MKTVKPVTMHTPMIRPATGAGAPCGMPRAMIASHAKMAFGLVMWMP